MVESVTLPPSQVGALATIMGSWLPSVMSIFTVVAIDSQPFPSVTTRVYIPLIAAVILVKVGSSVKASKSFGPDHAYAYGPTPPVTLASKVTSSLPFTQPIGAIGAMVAIGLS